MEIERRQNLEPFPLGRNAPRSRGPRREGLRGHRPAVISAGALLTLLLAAPDTARAQADTDGDGAPDTTDQFPCDADRASVSWYPGESSSALLSYEDQWPAHTDLDFNDVVVRVNYRLERHQDGRVKSVLAVFDPVALGGDLSNGLGLQLPALKNRDGSVPNVSARRRVGASQAWETLTPESDANVTLVLSANLRELYGDLTGRINSSDALTADGARLELDVTFEVPVAFSAALPFDQQDDAPFDVFIFRSGTGGIGQRHEIHFAKYAGTASMNASLFNTQQDVSDAAGSRRFIHQSGVPAALNLQTTTVYPSEGTMISEVFPKISDFGMSRGALFSNFYDATVPANAVSQDPARRRSVPAPALPSRAPRCGTLSLGSGTLTVAPANGGPGACTALPVSNGGATAVTGLALTFTGADAANFEACSAGLASPCAGSVPAGGTCDLGVRLLGGSNASYAATARVAGSTTGTHVLSVIATRALSGAGSGFCDGQTATYTAAQLHTVTVPSGCTGLEYEVWGAPGGSGADTAVWTYASPGGKGARMVGSISGLAGGATLRVLVGAAGNDHQANNTNGVRWGGGGGGGMSAIFDAGFNAYVIAAGGGGGSTQNNDGYPGVDANPASCAPDGSLGRGGAGWPSSQTSASAGTFDTASLVFSGGGRGVCSAGFGGGNGGFGGGGGGGCSGFTADVSGGGGAGARSGSTGRQAACSYSGGPGVTHVLGAAVVTGTPGVQLRFTPAPAPTACTGASVTFQVGHNALSRPWGLETSSPVNVPAGCTSLSFTVRGAGGSAARAQAYGLATGGRPASFTGSISGLTPGAALNVIVGGRPAWNTTTYVGGGGGLSGIFDASFSPYVVAGGGGGGGMIGDFGSGGRWSGCDANFGVSPNGCGGASGWSGGFGFGGGWEGGEWNGRFATGTLDFRGGGTTASNTVDPGGYGGGGAGRRIGDFPYGGGGGGWSGGTANFSGGGGGSFTTHAGVSIATQSHGQNTDEGTVTITWGP